MKLHVKMVIVDQLGEPVGLLKVIEQEPRVFLPFTSSNGWTVKSQYRPEILGESKKVFLRGEATQYDHTILLTRHPHEVRAALEEFAKHCADEPRPEHRSVECGEIKNY